MFQLIIFCAILSQITNADPIHPKTDVTTKFLDEILIKVNNEIDKCENFEKYSCGKVHVEGFKTLTDDSKISDKDRKIIENFQDTCDKAAKQQYKPDDVIQQVDFLKAHREELSKEKPNLINKDVSEIAALISELKLTKGMFLDVYYYFENYFYLSVSEQISFPAEKREEFGLFTLSPAVEKYLKNVNEVIKNPPIDFEVENYNKDDFITIETIEKLNELIPTKHFDWETYIAILTDFVNGQKINGVRILKTDLESLRGYFKIIDDTDIKTLIEYGLYEFTSSVYYATSLPIGPCVSITETLIKHATLRSMWSNIFASPSRKNLELEHLTEFEEYFNKTLAKIPNSNSNAVYEYFYKKRNFLKDINEYFDNYFKHFRHDKFYNNWIIFATKQHHKLGDPKMYDFGDENLKISYWDVINLSKYMLQYENKPIEIVRLLEVYEIAYLYFKQNKLWTNMKDLTSKCIKESIEDPLEFYSSYAAIQFVESFYENMSHSAYSNIPITFGQSFFIALTQNHCAYYDDIVKSVTHAFQYSKWFADEFNCAEGSKMNPAKDNECKLGYCPIKNFNQFWKDYVPFKLTDC